MLGLGLRRRAAPINTNTFAITEVRLFENGQILLSNEAKAAYRRVQDLGVQVDVVPNHEHLGGLTLLMLIKMKNEKEKKIIHKQGRTLPWLPAALTSPIIMPSCRAVRCTLP